MTDSFGNNSESSNHGGQSKLKMEVVCVIDLHLADDCLHSRKKAYEAINQACISANANCTYVQVNSILLFVWWNTTERVSLGQIIFGLPPSLY